MAPTPIILCVNSGSSSLKFALYQCADSTEHLLATGAVEQIGLPNGRLWTRDHDATMLTEKPSDFPNHQEAVRTILTTIKQLSLPHPTAVGHRLVHGGPHHMTPERVTPQLLASLRSVISFAPLHLPSALQAIEAVTTQYPHAPQVACFDTAFHRRMPEVAQSFPLPRSFWEDGLRRYGFHGLSYEYIMDKLGAASGRTIIAHLGNGASMAAVRDGQPLDTTMGFSPTGGLMMGTRSGDLDPGLLLYLLREKHYTAEQVDRLVNHEAGLLGVSGASSDMKTLFEQQAANPAAALAIAMFCYQLRKQLGAFIAVLGGLDTLVFTGGIGEHAATVRWDVCAGLAYMGLQLDAHRNAAHAEVISTIQSRCTVQVIPTNEDLMIARHTHALIYPHTLETQASVDTLTLSTQSQGDKP